MATGKPRREGRKKKARRKKEGEEASPLRVVWSGGMGVPIPGLRGVPSEGAGSVVSAGRLKSGRRIGGCYGARDS
ncbi:MAG TPA: hypothetical protein VJG48_01105 [Candidatus Paceibacterota bacterium]